MARQIDLGLARSVLPLKKEKPTRARNHPGRTRHANFTRGGEPCSPRSTGSAHAQETVKIGVILPYSGQFADTATQMDNGIKLYMKQHGDTVAGRKIEIIRKDTGGVAPDVAKRLAQELVVRDGVDILAGFVLTPNAIAASDVSMQAKKFMVIMNAATSIVTTKSDYSVRTSVTLPQICETFGSWAARRTAPAKPTRWPPITAPATIARAPSYRAFKAAGGEVIGSVRMPVANPDFSAFVQRAKDLNRNRSSCSFPPVRSLRRSAKHSRSVVSIPKKVKIFGSGEIADESAVKIMGDAAIGIITAWHYDYNHKSKGTRIS